MAALWTWVVCNRFPFSLRSGKVTRKTEEVPLNVLYIEMRSSATIT